MISVKYLAVSFKWHTYSTKYDKKITQRFIEVTYSVSFDKGRD